jgi:hypothetical protein
MATVLLVVAALLGAICPTRASTPQQTGAACTTSGRTGDMTVPVTSQGAR